MNPSDQSNKHEVHYYINQWTDDVYYYAYVNGELVQRIGVYHRTINGIRQEFIENTTSGCAYQLEDKLLKQMKDFIVRNVKFEGSIKRITKTEYEQGVFAYLL